MNIKVKLARVLSLIVLLSAGAEALGQVKIITADGREQALNIRQDDRLTTRIRDVQEAVATNLGTPLSGIEDPEKQSRIVDVTQIQSQIVDPLSLSQGPGIVQLIRTATSPPEQEGDTNFVQQSLVRAVSPQQNRMSLDLGAIFGGAGDQSGLQYIRQFLQQLQTGANGSITESRTVLGAEKNKLPPRDVKMQKEK